MSVRRLMTIINNERKWNFEKLPLLDCKTLECDNLKLGGKMITASLISDIEVNLLEGVEVIDDNVVFSKDINAHNQNIEANNIIGTIATGTQPLITTLPNITTLGQPDGIVVEVVRETEFLNDIKVVDKTTDPTFPLVKFHVDAMTGNTDVKGNMAVDGLITSPTITLMNSKINLLTAQMNKLLNYIIINDADSSNVSLSIKEDVVVNIPGSLNQG